MISILLTFALLTGSFDHASAEGSLTSDAKITVCGEALALTTYGEMIAEIDRQVNFRASHFTMAFLRQFHQTGLRYVRALEADHPGAVVDKVADAFETLDDLLAESSDRFGTPKKRPMKPNLVASFVALDIPQERERFSSRDVYQLRRLAGHFLMLAAMITLAHDYFDLGPSPDPFAPMTEAWMRAALDGVHHVSTEFALRESEEAELEMRNSWQKNVPKISETSRPDDATAPDFLNVITATAPIFDPAVIYTAQLTGEGFEDPLRISIDENVIKELEGPRRTQGLFLIRALTKPQRSDNGIKKLTSLGKSIVEIKRVMRGHLRYIGCLEGDRLRLLQLRDLPESIDAYAKLIPSNLCE